MSLCKRCDGLRTHTHTQTLCVGVSKRRWQTEIIQDHLEEADETFEVLLVSPESTVIGSINKATLTIRDSAGGKNDYFATHDGIGG